MGRPNANALHCRASVPLVAAARVIGWSLASVSNGLQSNPAHDGRTHVHQHVVNSIGHDTLFMVIERLENAQIWRCAMLGLQYESSRTRARWATPRTCTDIMLRSCCEACCARIGWIGSALERPVQVSDLQPRPVGALRRPAKPVQQRRQPERQQAARKHRSADAQASDGRREQDCNRCTSQQVTSSRMDAKLTHRLEWQASWTTCACTCRRAHRLSKDQMHDGSMLPPADIDRLAVQAPAWKACQYCTSTG